MEKSKVNKCSYQKFRKEEIEIKERIRDVANRIQEVDQANTHDLRELYEDSFSMCMAYTIAPVEGECFVEVSEESCIRMYGKVVTFRESYIWDEEAFSTYLTEREEAYKDLVG